MEVKFKFSFLVFLLFGVLFGITGNVLADLSGVQYPILELNSCNSQEDCKNFCDDVENIGACLDYAEKNNLMSKIDIGSARKVLPFLEGRTSPGSCETKGLCENYCNLDENFDECLEFSQDAKIISSDLYEIAKVTKGIGPGGCRRDECENYCSSPENFKTCLDFVENKGLIGVVVSSEDYRLSRKMIPLIEEGKMPGGCNSEISCNEYCGDKNNFEECDNLVLYVNGHSIKDFENEKSLNDFEGEGHESKTESEELEGHTEKGIEVNNFEEETIRKISPITSKNKISRGGGSSGLTNSISEEIEKFEDENHETEISEHELPSEDSKNGVSLVDEAIFTKPEINSEEKHDSLEEKVVENQEDSDHKDSRPKDSDHKDSRPKDSESQDSEESVDEGHSEESGGEGDKGDSKDSGDSKWTINSKVISPFQESVRSTKLFDFFKKILKSFY